MAIKKRRKEESEYSRRDKYNYGPRRKLNVYLYNSQKANREFHLTKEQAMEMFYKPCFYCGKEVKKYWLNGIDRIDNNKHYLVDNVVPCCTVCNELKGKKTMAEFGELIQKEYIVAKRRLELMQENISLFEKKQTDTHSSLSNVGPHLVKECVFID